MRPCQLVDGEPGVSPDVRLRPAFLLLRWFQAWPRLGCRGGPGPLSTRLGGLLRSVPIPETPQDLHTFRRQPCDAGHTSRVTLTYRGITQGRCQLDMATGANLVRLCQSLLWSLSCQLRILIGQCPMMLDVRQKRAMTRVYRVPISLSQNYGGRQLCGRKAF